MRFDHPDLGRVLRRRLGEILGRLRRRPSRKQADGAAQADGKAQRANLLLQDPAVSTALVVGVCRLPGHEPMAAPGTRHDGPQAVFVEPGAPTASAAGSGRSGNRAIGSEAFRATVAARKRELGVDRFDAVFVDASCIDEPLGVALAREACSARVVMIEEPESPAGKVLLRALMRHSPFVLVEERAGAGGSVVLERSGPAGVPRAGRGAALACSDTP